MGPMTMPMSPTKPGLPPLVLTDDQFEDMARTGAFARVGRVELRDGVLTPMNPNYIAHSVIATALVGAIRAELKARGAPLRALGEVTIRFGGGFQPVPDIVIVDRFLAPPDKDGPVQGRDVRMVIEVSSASLADDLGAKLAAYAAAGVREYWVVDVKKRLVLQHTTPEAQNEVWGYRGRQTVPLDGPLSALTFDLVLPAGALDD